MQKNINFVKITMQMVMENKVYLIIVYCLFIGSFCSAKNIVQDSLQNINLLDIELKRDSLGTGIILINNTDDSLIVRTSFFIDDPTKPSHILIYYCCDNETKDEVDSTNCSFGYATQMQKPPIIVEFNDRKILLKSHSKVFIPFAIPIVEECRIFIKMQVIVLYSDQLYYLNKTSNVLRFD